MKIEDWKDKRKKWTTARDAEKLKSGAVKGVNLGEAIDNVYSGWKKGVVPLASAVTKLLAAVKKYKTAISAKPNLVKWLTDNIEKPAQAVEDAVGDDGAAIQGIQISLQAFVDRGWLNFVFPEGEEFLKLGFKPDTKDWAKDSEPLYKKLRDAVAPWEAFGNEMTTNATGLKIAFPGHVGRQQFLSHADDVLHEVKLIRELCETQKQSVNHYAQKAKGCRDSLYLLAIALPNMQKSVKKLMAG